MEWKKETLQSICKVTKEKLILLFCAGLLLYVLALPGDSDSLAVKSGVVKDSLEEEKVVGAAASASEHEQTYEETLEARIRQILSNVDGVGEVDVMVVVKTSAEKVIHMDKTSSLSTTEDQSGGAITVRQTQQNLSESTVMDGQTSAPIVEKELSPELSGIIISADGGGSAVVKTEISEAMEALFGLPSHKIKVLKRVKKGV